LTPNLTKYLPGPFQFADLSERQALEKPCLDCVLSHAKLLESGQVKHRRDDGFHYRPPDPVDWMVCDMVESPSRIARLAARWIAEGWCRETIFNLKLPMKKRREEVERCRAVIDEALGGGGYYLRFKHLYHDREEVTGYLARRAAQPLHSAP